jgi:hypothetical protein
VNAPHPEETHSLDAPSPQPAQSSDDDPILTEEELELVKAAVSGRSHAEPAHAAEFSAPAPDPVGAGTSPFGASPAPDRAALFVPQPIPDAEPAEASGGRMRQAWDQIQMAFPRLMGQPAYGRPRSLFSPTERPFDPDDLPLEAERSADDRRAAQILATSAGTKERGDGGGRGWRSVTRLLRLGD